MLKRHEIQVLKKAGHMWREIAALGGASVRTVRRVAEEAAVTAVDNAAKRARRHVRRPSKADEYRDVLVKALADEPALRSVELLHRARQAGYAGGKSALHALAQTLRALMVTPLVRFEGLPGDFSQNDFGEVIVRYQGGTQGRSAAEPLDAAEHGGILSARRGPVMITHDPDLDALFKRGSISRNARRVWREFVQPAERGAWSYLDCLPLLATEEIVHRQQTRWRG